MGPALKMRLDYTADDLPRAAKRTKDSRHSRRLLSLAAVVAGLSCEEAARIGGMDRQTLR